MKYLKTFGSYKLNEGIPGGIGAIAGAHHKSKAPTVEEASDKPDEFLCNGLVNAIYNKWGSYNCKLVDCKINVVEEKKGFFNKLFSDSTTLELKLESERLKLPLVIKLKLKKDAFVRAFDKSDDKIIPGTIAEESIDKFIKYLLVQSKWSKELKEALPDIDKKLTKESFE